ncbi:MAG: hypothetical protein A2Y77_15115 [Planctomycetes bacterium RBG_13_62_9]|nr:MAG: hypothetical protein A2Y77_15115 [Planctomycetes bacterium RBG_13_62_9]
MQDLIALTQYASDDIIDPTLLACWKFDENDGAVACDSMETCSGTLVGNPTWKPDGGAAGGAIKLDGTDDYVSAALTRDPSQAPFSVFAWVKGGAPGQVILSQPKGANWLVVNASGVLMTDLRSPGRMSRALSSQAVITDGNWHRVGLVWDGINRTLYVDDAPVAADTQDGLRSAGGELQIGAGKDLASGTFWSGLIDDVRIYHRVIKP